MSVTLAKPGIDKIKPHMIGSCPNPQVSPALLLNSNESVYGPSPLARAAAVASASSLEKYVEHVDTIMAPAIGLAFGLNPDQITVGQGSDDLLARLARAYLGPNTNLIRSANGYLKVPNYAFANDADVISVPDEGFKPSVDRMIAAVTDETRIVYLANPENPAGTYLSGAEVRRLHKALPENVLMVLDCAYEEYVDAEDYEPAHILVGEADNVVMCKTFSKIYGLAGARIGWLYGNSELVDVIRRIALTFPVSSTAVAAALAGLEDRAHIRSVFEANATVRQIANERLSSLGLEVVPSQTNFVLIKFPDARQSAKQVDQYLRNRGIYLRRFASPAFDDYIRITLGHRSNVDFAIDTIADFLDGIF